MATIETAWKKEDGPVRYHAADTTVLVGDKVLVRSWLRKSEGVINYVPGLSAVHDEMEHDGLHWVGVAFARGTFIAILVDPDTGRTLKPLVFLRRGTADGASPLPAAPFE